MKFTYTYLAEMINGNRIQKLSRAINTYHHQQRRLDDHQTILCLPETDRDEREKSIYDFDNVHFGVVSSRYRYLHGFAIHRN